MARKNMRKKLVNLASLFNILKIKQPSLVVCNSFGCFSVLLYFPFLTSIYIFFSIIYNYKTYQNIKTNAIYSIIFHLAVITKTPKNTR